VKENTTKMAVSQILNKFKPKAEQNEQAEHTETSYPSATTSGTASLAEKNARYDDSKVPYLTWRSFILGVLASMGGFIFGYSTGLCPENWLKTWISYS
jgi:SP family sugar:H+ symporter-like MFS transporter